MAPTSIQVYHIQEAKGGPREHMMWAFGAKTEAGRRLQGGHCNNWKNDDLRKAVLQRSGLDQTRGAKKASNRR